MSVSQDLPTGRLRVSLQPVSRGGRRRQWQHAELATKLQPRLLVVAGTSVRSGDASGQHVKSGANFSIFFRLGQPESHP